MDILSLVPLLLLSFVSGIIDLSLGMGYGFTVTPIMLLLGYPPTVAVPSVLFSSFIGGAFSSFFNHHYKNVDFTLESREFKIAAFTAGLGIIGAIAGVYISMNIPARMTGLYIGVLVIVTGVLVIISRNLMSDFSWTKMSIISLIGSLNKGLTGSGFGPVITTGAMLSGIDEKAAVSIQSLSEASVSLVGFITYIMLMRALDVQVILTMSVGVVAASPFAALIVHRIEGKTLRILVGVIAIIIGFSTLWKYY